MTMTPETTDYLYRTAEYQGLDVAEYQGDVDWDKVKGDGIVFGWAKASGGGRNPFHEDPKYVRNRDGMRRVGIHDGAYHFWLGTAGAAAQARHFYNVAGPLTPNSLRPMVDFEHPPGGTISLDATRMRIMLEATRDHFGCWPVVYAGAEFWTTTWFREVAIECPRMVPNWTRRPSVTHHVWQYTDKGRVAGIAGYVDRDITYNLNYIINPQEENMGEYTALLTEIRDSVAAIRQETEGTKRLLRQFFASTRTRFVQALSGQDPEGKVWCVTPAGKWHVPDAAFLDRITRQYETPLESWDIDDLRKIPTISITMRGLPDDGLDGDGLDDEEPFLA